jgi:hypothetical protein
MKYVALVVVDETRGNPVREVVLVPTNVKDQVKKELSEAATKLGQYVDELAPVVCKSVKQLDNTALYATLRDVENESSDS